jgi:hypothetical protein
MTGGKKSTFKATDGLEERTKTKAQAARRTNQNQDAGSAGGRDMRTKTTNNTWNTRATHSNTSCDECDLTRVNEAFAILHKTELARETVATVATRDRRREYRGRNERRLMTRMYESNRTKKHKIIQQRLKRYVIRLNGCVASYSMLNRFTSCVASKLMFFFTSILACFKGCFAHPQHTPHYLLYPHTTQMWRSSDR